MRFLQFTKLVWWTFQNFVLNYEFGRFKSWKVVSLFSLSVTHHLVYLMCYLLVNNIRTQRKKSCQQNEKKVRKTNRVYEYILGISNITGVKIRKDVHTKVISTFSINHFLMPDKCCLNRYLSTFKIYLSFKCLRN